MDVGLGADGDIPVFCRFIEGEDQTEQRLRLRLLIHQKEWLLDRSAGMPFSAWAATKPPPLEVIRGQVQREIETCPGVARVESVTVAFDENAQRVTVTAAAVLDGGQRLSVTLGVPAPGAVNAQAFVRVSGAIR